MQIFFVNNDGGGFASKLEVQEGTTVGQLFEQQVPHGKPQDYLVRVNRLPAPADQALRENDRCTFTPTKIEGAVK